MTAINKLHKIILTTLAECPEGASESAIWLGIQGTGISLDNFQYLLGVYNEKGFITNFITGCPDFFGQFFERHRF